MSRDATMKISLLIAMESRPTLMNWWFAAFFLINRLMKPQRGRKHRRRHLRSMILLLLRTT
ncbi:hypothetical protein LINPERPRIM_LOCUS14883 [Linum perenne]